MLGFEDLHAVSADAACYSSLLTHSASELIGGLKPASPTWRLGDASAVKGNRSHRSPSSTDYRSVLNIVFASITDTGFDIDFQETAPSVWSSLAANMKLPVHVREKCAEYLLESCWQWRAFDPTSCFQKTNKPLIKIIAQDTRNRAKSAADTYNALKNAAS